MEEKTLDRAILVSICERSSEMRSCERSLDELERLLETAGGSVFARVIQIKDSYDARTVIGKGKVEEIRALCESAEIDLVIFDVELSPMQIRNLEEAIDISRVIDRSMLILDIFALHATSGEGKLQVELAQLKYSAPRLIGRGKALSRQGGGIGTRGPGETKLETDRRHLNEKIAQLEARLAEIEHNRATMRRSRDSSGIPKIAVVGYTNAGKSTLLNRLTDANVLAENKLFATLDATTRRMTLPEGEAVLITDTVGFIRRLPHHLVEAFKSTLDELRLADILLIVSDASDPEVGEHLTVTESIIEELGAADKPRIYAYNKCDAAADVNYAVPRNNTVMISAKSGIGIGELLLKLTECIHEGKYDCELIFPYNNSSKLNALYNKTTVKSCEYLDDGIHVTATLDEKLYGMFKDFIKEEL